MKNVTCIIHIRNGEIINKSAVRKAFDSLKDGRYLMDIEDRTKRSNPQNRYLHGVLIPEFRNALMSVGYDVPNNAVAKNIMKSIFLKRSVTNLETGEMMEYIQDTSDMTKEEGSILIEEVVRFCAENMSYVIPLPNEQLTVFA